MRSKTRAGRTRCFLTVAAACLIIVSLTPQAALSKITTWTNLSPSDDLWSNPGNWDNGIPGTSDEVFFDPIGGTSTQDIPGLGLLEMSMGTYSGTLTLLQPLDIAGDLQVSGLLDASGATMVVGGSISVDGDLDATGASVLVMGDVVVIGSLTGTVGGLLTVQGSLQLDTGATLDMGDGTLEIGGDLSLSAGNSTWSGGTLRFQGSSQSWDAGPASSSFGNVEINQPGPDIVDLLTAGLVVEMDELFIAQGTLQLDSGGLTVHGSLDISGSGGLVNHSSGATLHFGGPIFNGGTFSSMESGCTLGFAPGTGGAVNVSGSATFEIAGLPGDRTLIEQDGVMGGTQWILDHDPGATLIFQDVEVQDSYAQPGMVTATGDCRDLGNNTNWDFPPKVTTWTGGGVSDNWSEYGNWDNGVPATDDEVLFGAVGGPCSMDISGLILDHMDMTGFTGTLTLMHPLAVTDNLKVDGLMDVAGQSLDVGGSLAVDGELDVTSSTLSVEGQLTVTGTFEGPGSLTTVGGNLVVGGSLNATTADLEVASDMDALGPCYANGANVHISGSFGGMAGGSIDITGATCELEGDLIADGGLSIVSGGGGGGGVLRFNGAGVQDWAAGSSAQDYGNVEITGGGGGGRVMLSSASLVVSVAELNVSGGTLELAGGDLHVADNMTVSPGAAFENNTSAGSTLGFEGAVTVVGGTFRCTAGGCTLRFQRGSLGGMVDLDGGTTFEITGLTGNRTRLEQDGTAGGDQWLLSYEPTVGLIFDEVDVQDSDAQPGPVTPTNSLDLGNNTGWDFPPKTTAWTGSGVTENWSDFENWDNGVPGGGDDVRSITVAGLSEMDVPGLTLNSLDFSGFTGTLTLHNSLDVAGHVVTDGTFDMSGQTLDIGGGLSTHGAFSASAANLTVGGGLTVDGSLDADGGHLEIHGVTHGAPGSTLDLDGGTLSLHSSAYLCDFGGVNIHSGGRIESYCSVDSELDLGGSLSMGHLYLSHTASAVALTLRSSGTVTLQGDLDVSAGTLDLDVGNLDIMGDAFLRLNGTIQGTYRPSYDVEFNGELDVEGGFIFTSGIVNATLKQGSIMTGIVRVEGFGSELRIAPAETVKVDVGGELRVRGGILSNRAKLLLDGPAHSSQWHLDVRPGAVTQFENIEVQDSDASAGETCTGTGECIDLGNNDNWSFVYTGEKELPPSRLSLRASPNPFNPGTTLYYSVPGPGNVTIRIYGVDGGLVRNLLSDYREPGFYDEAWDGRDDKGSVVATGVYFCRIESSGASVVRKLLLLR